MSCVFRKVSTKLRQTQYSENLLRHGLSPRNWVHKTFTDRQFDSKDSASRLLLWIYSREILFDTFNVLGPDAEQPAEVSADERAGVEDEGGAVEAEVDVGGDGHHQRALVAVQVLQQFAQYSRIYQDTKTPMAMTPRYMDF